MSNVIRFLEAAGRRPLSPSQYAATVALLDVGERQKQALLDRDAMALELSLGERRDMCCLIVVPEEG